MYTCAFSPHRRTKSSSESSLPGVRRAAAAIAARRAASSPAAPWLAAAWRLLAAASAFLPRTHRLPTSAGPRWQGGRRYGHAQHRSRAAGVAYKSRLPSAAHTWCRRLQVGRGPAALGASRRRGLRWPVLLLLVQRCPWLLLVPWRRGEGRRPALGLLMRARPPPLRCRRPLLRWLLWAP